MKTKYEYVVKAKDGLEWYSNLEEDASPIKLFPKTFKTRKDARRWKQAYNTIESKIFQSVYKLDSVKEVR